MRAPAPADVSDAIARVLGGQTQAFEVVLRRHNQRLFRLARSLLGDEDDALDVLQEAYVTAFHRLGQLSDPAKVGAWLARIVRNQALMHLRARWRLERLDQEEEARLTDDGAWLAGEVRAPDAAVLDAQLAAVLESSIDGLPAPFRTVFVLRAVEGMPVEEVAALLDVPAATVKTRYFRARKTLRTHLARRLDLVSRSVFPFGGDRCDRLVAVVLRRIREEAPERARR